MHRWASLYPASIAAWPEAAASGGGLAAAGARDSVTEAAEGRSCQSRSRAGVAAAAVACCAQQDTTDAQQTLGIL